MFRHRGGSNEVVRGGARRLKKQSLHRPDATIGPKRKKHQRHSRAVFVQFAIVFPQRATATLLGVLSKCFHGLHYTEVLAVSRLAFVASEIPSSPAINKTVIC